MGTSEDFVSPPGPTAAPQGQASSERIPTAAQQKPNQAKANQSVNCSWREIKAGLCRELEANPVSSELPSSLAAAEPRQCLPQPQAVAPIRMGSALPLKASCLTEGGKKSIYQLVVVVSYYPHPTTTALSRRNKAGRAERSCLPLRRSPSCAQRGAVSPLG